MKDIGKVIYYLLDEAKINCYPIVAENGTQFPFVVYKRLSYTPTTGKDCMIYNADVTVEITVMSDKYDESLTIAESVIQALNFKKGTINNIDIIDTQLIDASEDYNEDCFLQTLTFKFRI